MASAALVPCCSTANITAAISSAVNNDVLTLGGGTFTGGCGFSLGGAAKNLTLVGNGNLIQCGSENVFNLVNEGAGDSLLNVRLAGTGSAVVASGTTLTIRDSTFYPFVCAYALSFTNGGLTLTNSTIIGSTIDGSSGAALTATNATILITGSTIYATSSATAAAPSPFYVVNSRVTISSSVFRANTGLKGGGILAYGGALSITANSNFTSNSALNGAGLCADGRCQLTVHSSSFTYNTGSQLGGAFCVLNGTASIQSSVISNNRVNQEGSVAYLHTGTLFISNCTLVSNTAYLGIVFADQPTGAVTITGSTFLASFTITADVFANYYNNITFTNSVVRNTPSLACITYYGYTIVSNVSFTNVSQPVAVVSGSTLELYDSTMVNCTSNQYGLVTGSIQNVISRNVSVTQPLGARVFFQTGSSGSWDLRAWNIVYTGASTDSVVYFESSQFVNFTLTNSSIVGGGTHFDMHGTANNIQLSLLGCSLIGGMRSLNMATNTNGGIVIRDTLFLNNGASGIVSGAAVNVYSLQVLTNATFIGNTGAEAGALWVSSGALVLSGIVFRGNSATSAFGLGGAFRVPSLVCTGCVFTNNQAVQGGGVYANNITLSNCTVGGNTASDGAGVFSSGPFTGTNVTFNDNTGSTATGLGGGVRAAGDVSCTGCSFTRNRANQGGAIYSNVGYLSLVQTSFVQNSATGPGAGISLLISSGISIVSCSFIQNLGSQASGSAVLSAVAISGSHTLQNSTFVGNLPTQYDGGITVYGIATTVHTVQNCSFTNFGSSLPGAALYLVYGTLITISSVTFTSCSSASDGGAVILQGSTAVAVTNAVFNGCIGVNGAAMYASAVIAVSISGSTFKNTLATQGALFVTASTTGVILNSTAFTSNTATSTAGALYYPGNRLTITSCTFTGAQAGATGSGAISVGTTAGPTVTIISNSTFTACSTTGPGGAAYIRGGTANITDCFFSSSSAYYGGGLMLDSVSWPTVQRCGFVNNTCTTACGLYAIQSTAVGLALIQDSTFDHNSCLSGGSAASLYIAYITARVYNCTVTNNVADAYGTMFQTKDTVLVNSTFRGNTAQYGGGVMINPILAPFAVNVQNCLFIANVGLNGAGGLQILSAPYGARVSSCTFIANSGLTGGAIGGSPTGSGILTVENCTMTNSTASQSGGAVYVTSGASVLQNSTIMTATAANGGAIYSTASTLTLTGIRISGCSASAAGGGIYARGNLLGMNQVWISNATCQGEGGAVAAYSLPVAMSNCTIQNAWSGSNGGALSLNSQLSGMSFTISGTSIVNAYAAQSGGALYLYCSLPSSSTFITLSALTIGSSSCAGNGGAVYASFPGILTITNSQITGSSANAGGGVWADAAAITASGTTFQSNKATLFGGAINALVALVQSSSFLLNTANTGGAINLGTSGQMSATAGSIFAGNFATADGGAISTGIEGECTLSGTTFSSNSATGRGGSVFFNYVTRSVRVSSTSFNSNTAGTGGALYIATASADVLLQATFSLNSATTSGGAIYAFGPVSISASSFTQGSASRGAAIASLDALNVSSSLFSQNTASGEAGGIYCQGCVLSLDGSQFISNTAPTGASMSCTASAVFTLAPNVSVMGDVSTVAPALPMACGLCGCCDAPVLPVLLTASAPCIPYPGRNCSYQCAAGYQPTTSQNLTQCSPASITLTPFSLCAPIACAPLTPPQYGIFNAATGAVTGAMATITCESGFNVVGNNTFTCVGPTWVGTVPYCQARACPPLHAPRNGSLSADTGDFGDNVTYYCNSGFTLSGTVTVTCQPDSTWSAGAPLCIPKPCATPSAPVHGYISSLPSPIVTGDTVIFDCDNGYALSGGETITCLGGSYDLVPPTCAPLSCPLLIAPANGMVINGSNATTGDVAIYSCASGFFVNGNVSRLCQSPAWTGAEPTCDPVFCNATDTIYTKSTCSGPVPFLGSCTVTCVAGTSGGMSLSAALCQQVGQTAVGIYDPPLPDCTPCGDGFWSVANSGSCTQCASAGHTTTTMATTPADCLCSPDFYELHPGTGDCTPCPVGAVCAGNKEPPIADKGFYQAGAAFVACLPASSCTGNNTCDAGYTGYRCANCEAGYYRLNGVCRTCPNDGAWRIVVGVLAGLVVTILLVLVVRPSPVSERARGLTSLTIGLSFVQIVATFANLKISWPSGTNVLFDIFSTFNLNIEIVSPECVISLDVYQKLEILLLIPIVVLGLLLVAYVIIMVGFWVRNNRPSLRSMGPDFLAYAEVTVAGYLFFLTMCYLFLSQAALSIFACTQQPNGRYTLNRSPGDECYTDSWYRSAGLGVFAIIAYIFGIPVAVHIVYFRTLRRYGSFIAGRSLFSNFLVQKYKEAYWFWDAIVMLRKLLMVIITLFLVTDPYLQVSLCCVVSLLAWGISVSRAPYVWQKHNAVSLVALSGELIVLFCGLLAANPVAGSVQLELANVLSLLVTIVTIGAIVVCATVEIWIYVNVRRLFRSLDVDKVGSLPIGNTRLAGLLNVRPGVVTVVSSAGNVTSWTIATMQPERGFNTNETIDHVALMGDDMIIARGSTLEIWDETRQLKVSSAMSQQPITHLAASHDGIVTGDASGGLSFWNTLAETDAPEKPVPVNGSFDGIRAAEDGDANIVLLASTAPRLTNRRPRQGQLLRGHIYVPAHEGPICALHMTRSFLFTTGSDAVICSWNFKAMTKMREWRLISTAPVCVLEECGGSLFGGCQDGSIVIVDMTTDAVRRYRRHTAAVRAITVYQSMVVSGSEDGTIIVSDVETGQYLQTIPGRNRGAVNVIACTGVRQLFWSDTSGVLKNYAIKVRWHVRDHDPHVLSRLLETVAPRCCQRQCAQCCPNAKEKSIEMDALSVPVHNPIFTYRDSGDAPRNSSVRGNGPARVYTELELMAEELNMPDFQWQQLNKESAEAIVAALRGETAQRRGQLLDRHGVFGAPAGEI